MALPAIAAAPPPRPSTPTRSSATSRASWAARATGSPSATRPSSPRPAPPASTPRSSRCRRALTSTRSPSDDAWDEAYGLNGGADNIPLDRRRALHPALRRSTTTSSASASRSSSLAGGYTAEDDALVGAARPPARQRRAVLLRHDRPLRQRRHRPTTPAGHRRRPPRRTASTRPTRASTTAATSPACARTSTTSRASAPPRSGSRRASRTSRCRARAPNARAGYHGYWITDFTQIDPHLGTNAELEALIAEAHAKGIKVYFDIITNHTADVIDYAEGQYAYVDQATSPYSDADGTAFDPADYAGTGSFPALDPATSFPYTPVIAGPTRTPRRPAWLNDPTLYHNRGNSTWTGESVTYGDFDGLDDLMTEHPTVVDGFVDVYKDWIDLGIDGFRIDTAKHVNFEFWEQWTTEVLDYAHAAGTSPTSSCSARSTTPTR